MIAVLTVWLLVAGVMAVCFCLLCRWSGRRGTGADEAPASDAGPVAARVPPPSEQPQQA